jgi:GH24 family phage-related lysozyme (muramidase)
MKAVDLIAAHEGLRLVAYPDVNLTPTIGFGQHIESLTVDQRAWLTASHGSVLAAMKGITFEEARRLLSESVARLEAWAAAQFPWFAAMCETRQAVIIDMAYELGEGRPGRDGLLGFPRFLACCAAGDFVGAVREMKASHWAKQVPGREQNDALLLLNPEPVAAAA